MNLNLKLLRALLAGVAVLSSNHNVPGAEKYPGQCDIVFKGDSTLDAFTGNISNVTMLVLCDTNAAGEAVLNTRIEISPQQLTTHHEKRDAKMYKMFQPDRFPELIIVVTNASLAAAKLSPAEAPGTAGTLPVQFTFCGITKEARATTDHPKLLANGWEFDLATEVSLKAFKLQPPSMLFGAISVSDTVKIKAHVKVQKEPPRF